MAVLPAGRPGAGCRWVLAVQPVMMMMVVRRRGVGAGRVQVTGDGALARWSPPGQLEAGSRRRRQYGACTGLHVDPARGIPLLLHPADDDDVLLARPIRWPTPIGRSAARSRAAARARSRPRPRLAVSADDPATGDGTAAGDDVLPAPRLIAPPVAATSNLDPEIETSPAAADVLVLFLLLFLLPLHRVPNGGTSRLVRILRPREPRDLLVETLRILIRRHCCALPQLVYWLEAA